MIVLIVWHHFSFASTYISYIKIYANYRWHLRILAAIMILDVKFFFKYLWIIFLKIFSLYDVKKGLWVSFAHFPKRKIKDNNDGQEIQVQCKISVYQKGSDNWKLIKWKVFIHQINWKITLQTWKEFPN